MTEDKTSNRTPLAFVSLALGIFVLVCSGVIAGTLLSAALKDEIAAEELEKAFSTYEDIANIMFALGDELVSSVDFTMSEDTDLGNVIVSRKITNKVLKQIKQDLGQRWLKAENYIVDEIEERLRLFREFIRWKEQITAIKTYIDLSQWIFRVSLETDHAMSQKYQVITYIVFMKGMSQRFGEMALSTTYLKTDLPFSVIDLLNFRIGSKETLDMAFSFETRAHYKLQALQTHATNVTYLVIEDALASGSLRKNGQFAETYAEAVKEETAGLFLAKGILNNTLYSVVQDTTDRAQKKLYFNMTTIIVSVAGLILCLMFFMISRASSRRQTGSPEIYSHL